MRLLNICIGVLLFAQCASAEYRLNYLSSIKVGEFDKDAAENVGAFREKKTPSRSNLPCRRGDDSTRARKSDGLAPGNIPSPRINLQDMQDRGGEPLEPGRHARRHLAHFSSSSP